MKANGETENSAPGKENENIQNTEKEWLPDIAHNLELIIWEICVYKKKVKGRADRKTKIENYDNSQSRKVWALHQKKQHSVFREKKKRKSNIVVQRLHSYGFDWMD